VVISIFDDVEHPHYGGGGALVVEKLARKLSEEFHTTVVTTSRGGGARMRSGVLYRYLPLCWAGPRAAQVLFHTVLPFVARWLPHDLWIESFTPPFSTSFLPLFSGAEVIGLGQQLSGEAMWRRYGLPFHVVERLGLRLYRSVVTLNDADASLVRRHSPNATVHVIPNGVERRRLNAARLGQGEHILFLGRIDLNCKGLDLLLAAYARAAPPMPLLVAGSGPPQQERRLEAMLATAGEGVRWLGHVGDEIKQDLLDRSAFLVMPSRNESFGIAALEAMSCGKPILHFDLPSLGWMGGGDVAVPPFDVDLFAANMRELATDAELRRRLGRQSYLSSERYTWDSTAARYLSLVRHLLCSRDATPSGA
jgi:glycosyltransferase involved in cell wall biosynthesis